MRRDTRRGGRDEEQRERDSEELRGCIIGKNKLINCLRLRQLLTPDFSPLFRVLKIERR